MNIKDKILVTQIQRFCMHDGPGLRTTVFLKGCPLRCKWCHNPETQRSGNELIYNNKCIGCRVCETVCRNKAHIFDNNHFVDREKCIICGNCAENCPTGALEICGNEMSVLEILSIVERDCAFYGTNGGLTISGGEPFMQSKAVIRLLEECKKKGMSTVVETCGYADRETLIEALPFVDLFLWDIKDTNDIRHKQYTGVSNRKIIENLNALGNLGAKIRLRCIIVSGVNTDSEHYSDIAKIALSVPGIEGIDLIPYHAYAGVKSVFLGLKDNSNNDWIPSNEEIEKIKSFLIENGIDVKVL